jgi:surface carbohydrate biosynthesis protein
MSCRVVIRAFTLRRDLGWAILLKNSLELDGADVIIACSRNYSWIIRVWKPHVVIFNTVGQVENSRNNAPNSKLVHWPAEGGEPWRHCDARILSERPQLFDDLAAVFVWGEDSLNQYKRAFPSKSLGKVMLCGNPRLDVIKYGAQLITEGAKSIGFATRFNSICHFDGRPTLYTLTRSGNRESVIGQVNGLVTTIGLIKLVLEKTDYPISIRPHPLEAPEYYEQYIKKLAPTRINIDTGFDFALWVKRQNVVIAPTSSSFVESYILQKPVINTDVLSGTQELGSEMNEYSSFTGHRNTYAPATEEAFLSLLNQIVEKNIKASKPNTDMDTHLEYTHSWPRDYSSIQKGATKIITIAKANKAVPKWWPVRWAIELKDNRDFSRRISDEPLHGNKNYHKNYHKVDPVYGRITKKIRSFKSDS